MDGRLAVTFASDVRVGFPGKLLGGLGKTSLRAGAGILPRPCCMDHPEGCLIIVFFNTGDNLDAT